MKFNPLPWLAILAMLVLAIWARGQLIEQNELGFYCDAGGVSTTCKIRWLIVQSFNHFGLGYFGLFMGLLAVLTRSGFIGLCAGLVSMAGLILYNWDFSAVGFLLGVLTLARAQWNDYREQQRSRQQQA